MRVADGEPGSGASMLRDAVRVLVIAIAYAVTGRIGLQFAGPSDLPTVIWPPSGIALAGTLLWGPRAAIGIALGQAAVAVTWTSAPWLIAAVSLGNAAGALSGAGVLKRLIPGGFSIRRVRDCLYFLAVGVAISAVVPAVFNMTVICAAGIRPWAIFWNEVRNWMLGDALGILLFTPAIMAWLTGGYRLPRARELGEMSLIAATLAAACGMAFLGERHEGGAMVLEYLPIPVVVWAALRIGSRGASAATIAVGVASAISGRANLAAQPDVSVLPMNHAAWIFLAVMSGTAIVLAAVATERSAALARLARSIEDARASEQAARESEARFRMMFERHDSVMLLVDPVGRRVVNANLAAERFYGYPRSMLRGMSIESLNAAPAAVLADAVEQAVAGKKNRFVFSHRLADGTQRTVETRTSPVELGGRVLLFSIIQDVTEQLAAEDSLRKSEATNRALVRSLPDLLFRMDANGTYLDYHAPDVDALYLKPSQFLGRSVQEVFPPELAAMNLRAIREALSTGTVQTYEYAGPRADSDRWWEVRVSACSETEALVLVRDITERKLAEAERERLEGQMRHAQKLESLGVLAGGIAHDFNNLLVGIIGNAGLAKKAVEPGSPAAELIERIEQASTRASDLTRQMLAYSGRGKFLVERCDLSDLVREMGRLLESSVARSSRLTFELASGLPRIEVDSTQVRQVVMNLITNASDSMGDRAGEVVVRTGVAVLDRDELERATFNGGGGPGSFVFVEVQDNGCGMDQETLGRIFEPFFTTKFTGRGLGLSAVQGIVRGHRGAIVVETRPGLGTRFRVLLPAARERLMAGSAPEADVGAPAAEVGARRAVVLVIDDELVVRDMVIAALRLGGMHGIGAVGGVQGVEEFKRRPDEFDLVILDLTMPVMSGPEVLHELRRIRPNVRVLVMSGYTEEDVAERVGAVKPDGFVSKPFTLDGLMKRVRGLIPQPDSPPAAASR